MLRLYLPLHLGMTPDCVQGAICGAGNCKKRALTSELSLQPQGLDFLRNSKNHMWLFTQMCAGMQGHVFTCNLLSTIILCTSVLGFQMSHCRKHWHSSAVSLPPCIAACTLVSFNCVCATGFTCCFTIGLPWCLYHSVWPTRLMAFDLAVSQVYPMIGPADGPKVPLPAGSSVWDKPSPRISVFPVFKWECWWSFTSLAPGSTAKCLVSIISYKMPLALKKFRPGSLAAPREERDSACAEEEP